MHTGIEPPFLSANILWDHFLYDLELYIVRKILNNRDLVNFQKFDFLRLFFINCVTTGERELNAISGTGLDRIIQSTKCESPT